MSLFLPKRCMTAGVVLAGLVAIACSNQVGSSGLNSPLNSPSETIFVADTGPGPVPKH